MPPLMPFQCFPNHLRPEAGGLLPIELAQVTPAGRDRLRRLQRRDPRRSRATFARGWGAWGLVAALAIGAASSTTWGRGATPSGSATGGLPADQAADASAGLPQSSQALAEAIRLVDQQLAEARRQAAAGISDTTATAEERADAADFLQQRVITLDQQGRHLRSLADRRRLDAERRAERDTGDEATEVPTLAQVEEWTDAASTTRLHLRRTQMLLGILESEIARHANGLEASRREVRLLEDGAEAEPRRDARHSWRLRLARLRNQSEESAVESAEVGRRLCWESLSGDQAHLEFLERRLAAARGRARMTKADLEGILRSIAEKRASLRQDLNEAVAADLALRTPGGCRTDEARNGPGEDPEAAGSGTVVAQARLETSGQKVDSLRGFLRLTEYAQAVWEDRWWLTEPRTLPQLRARRERYEQHLAGLRQWRTLMEQSLPALSDQLLRQALKAEDGRLPARDRDVAKALFTTLQERAWVELRTLGGLVFAENLTTRLLEELTQRSEEASVFRHLQSGFETLCGLAGRVWNTELYIAEDTTIAGGQKVSLPRSITVGKVGIALTLFLLGLLAARAAHRLVGRWNVAGQGGDGPGDAALPNAAACLVAGLSLVVAMTSVRIPWTAFAFLGGALAIGVGFGAQTLINNFISGVILWCERRIRVGDIVQVDDQRGKIVRVGVRSSLMSRGDGIEVLVPNSQFLEKKVINWTLSDDLVRQAVSVRVAYGVSPNRAVHLIEQTAAAHPKILQQPAPQVLLDDIGDHALTFTLHFWLRLGPGIDGGKVRSELRLRIHDVLRGAGARLGTHPTECCPFGGSPSGVGSETAARREPGDCTCPPAGGHPGSPRTS